MKKGFTLMEILVVVIVLGVVSLITFPVVRNIIDKNRKSTFEEAVEGMIRSTQLYISNNGISEDFEEPYNTEKIKMEKNYMNSGTIVYENGEIKVENLTDGNYCANGSKKNMQITKGNCSSN